MNQVISWPDGKLFAFSVFDDTDRSTVANVKEVYALLRDQGVLTTKSVWPVAGREAPEVVGGSTCEDPGYLAWVLQLQKEGFEIGFHNATYHSSTREETVHALGEFVRLFGQDPKTMATHTRCREGMYWGRFRLTGLSRSIYDFLKLGRQRNWFQGHMADSPYFWGDVCRARVPFVRNFVFPETNTLAACPFMPYHDPARPFVNAWFSSTDGGTRDRFNAAVAESNQDQLEAGGGACIMYTHFGKHFHTAGGLDLRFRKLIERLARKNGWFVPVATLLEFLLAQRGCHLLTDEERARLEWRWLRYKLRTGTC